MLDVIDSIRHQKQGLTTSESIEVEGLFVVRLSAQKTETHFLNTKLPLNERDNDFNNQLSFDNFRMTVRQLHNCGWKNSSHKSADVAMLGYGCGVSMYPKFCDKDLKSFHMLPRPYIRYFDGQCSDQIF